MMKVFAETNSSKIDSGIISKDILCYHAAVITILGYKSLKRLFRNSTHQSVQLCNAAAGLYCTFNQDSSLTIEYSTSNRFKPGTHISLSAELIKLLQNGNKTILTTIDSLHLELNNKTAGSQFQQVILSSVYIRKKIDGFHLFFDDKNNYCFTDHDYHKISIFSETVSFAVDNILTISLNKKKAQTDSLTGLYNHQAFFNRADYEMRRSLRYNRPLSMCLFDIDNFKEINDHYGHVAGDKILVLLSDICRKVFRTIDYCARYGGDEFCVILTETPIQTAKEVMVRLQNTVRSKSLMYRSCKVTFSISIGIASIDQECSNVEKLIERADAAMYQAKQSGNERIVLWRKSAASKSARKMSK
jgi:diguanylate cyclase (GGDEF)-like protein